MALDNFYPKWSANTLYCEHLAHEKEEFQLFHLVGARYDGPVLNTLSPHRHQADFVYSAFYEFV